MPPFVPSKRRLSTRSPHAPTPQSAKKPSLFETADKPDASATLQDNKVFLDQLGGSQSDSSLSDVSTADLEDALLPSSSKRIKITHHEERDEDEVEWEDAMYPTATPCQSIAAGESGDLELTLDKNAHVSPATNPHKRKGPSKIERQIRISTHIMHVQFLLFHNLIRNGWACDGEVQRILVGQLPPSVSKEVTRWKTAAGLIPDAAVEDAKSKVLKTKKGKCAEHSERNQRE
jgi:xeroderma pigmentosum group C-complementing protein